MPPRTVHRRRPAGRATQRIMPSGPRWTSPNVRLLTTEDLPRPDNRVSVDGDQIMINWTPNNLTRTVSWSNGSPAPPAGAATRSRSPNGWASRPTPTCAVQPWRAPIRPAACSTPTAAATTSRTSTWSTAASSPPPQPSTRLSPSRQRPPGRSDCRGSNPQRLDSAPTEAQKEIQNMPNLRLGLIGASNIAMSRMLPAFAAAGIQVHGLYDSDSRRLRYWAARDARPPPAPTDCKRCRSHSPRPARSRPARPSSSTMSDSSGGRARIGTAAR